MGARVMNMCVKEKVMKSFGEGMKSAFFYISAVLVLATGLSVAGADQIQSGQTSSSYITAPSYRDTWTFEGQAGERVLVAAAGAFRGIEPEIFLYPPDSDYHEVVVHGDVRQYRMLDHQLQMSGQYTIVIRDWHMDETGKYGISFVTLPGRPNNSEDRDGGGIEVAGTMSGNIGTADLPEDPLFSDLDVFRFEGQAGERVLVTVSSTELAVEPEILLYPPDSGDQEAFAGGDETQHRMLDHVLAASGEYTIVVREWEMNREGSYSISLVKIPGDANSISDTDGGPIESGSTLSGSIGNWEDSDNVNSSDTDVYQFAGESGDRVVITVAETEGGFQPEILLYPPDSGAMEAIAVGDPYHFRTLDHQLAGTGLYTIVVRDWLMNDEGNYDISLAKMPGQTSSAGSDDGDGGDMTSGMTVKAKFDSVSDTDVYRFYGEMGERVIITLSGVVGDVEPELLLYPPSGEREAFVGGDGYRYRLLDHELQAGGIYTIVVREWRMDDTGEYDVSFVKMPGPAFSADDRDGGDIAAGQSVYADLFGCSDTDVFRFYGEAGDRVIIKCSQISGHVEPEISLYPPDGGEREAFSGGWGFVHTLDVNLEQSGLYRVVVGDYQMDEEGRYLLYYRKIPDDVREGLYDPCPSNGGSVEECFVESLQWWMVGDADSFDVYFGPDVTMGLDKIAENIERSTVPWPMMERCETYYWYAVAHTPKGDITGPWWWLQNHFCDIASDLNGDGQVNFVDFALLATHWLGEDSSVNIVGSDKIDNQDIGRMGEDWLDEASQ